MNVTSESPARSAAGALSGLRSWLKALIAGVLDNPVAMKELRSRMRGPRAYWILLGYQGLLGAILFFMYLTWWQNSIGSGQPIGPVGRRFFEALFYTQAALMTIIVPAITSGTITLENEQRTFEMLAITTLTARQVIMGKLLPAVLFAALLLTSSLPMASIAFLLGGISPAELLAAYVILVVGCFLFAALGVGWSVVASRTAAATSASIATVVLYTVLTVPASLGADRLFIQAVHPISAVTKALATWPFFGIDTPCWIPGLLINLLAGVLLVTLAASNMPLLSSRLTLTLRAQWAALFLLMGLCVSGNVWGTALPNRGQAITPTEAREVVGILCTLAYAVSLAVLPAFCTEQRDIYSVASGPGAGWRARLSTLSTAPFYLATLLVVCFVFFAMGLPITGRSLALVPACWWLKMLAACLIPLLSFGAISVLLSRVMPTRGLAAGTTLALIVVLSLMPFLSLIGYDPWQTPERPMIQNTLYLSSGMSLFTVINPTDFSHSFPQFAKGPNSFWLITSGFYAALGLLALGLSRITGRPRTGTVQDGKSADLRG